MKNKYKKRHIKGNKGKLRLSVFRSNTNISVQLIDDEKQVTVAGVSSIKNKKETKTKTAIYVGELIAQKAKEKKVSKVVFDRGNKPYKGRIKALADSARKNGLIF